MGDEKKGGADADMREAIERLIGTDYGAPLSVPQEIADGLRVKYEAVRRGAGDDLRELITMIEVLQWASSGSGHTGFCPECGSESVNWSDDYELIGPGVHKADCSVGQLLARLADSDSTG